MQELIRSWPQVRTWTTESVDTGGTRIINTWSSNSTSPIKTEIIRPPKAN